MTHVVIVGAGLAGYRAALTLRRSTFDGDLTVVGSEDHHPYDRPPLSKRLLAGEVDARHCFFDCDDLDIAWRLGHAAKRLNPVARELELVSGQCIRYDRLVIATGRRAREWPSPPRLEGFHTLRTIDDAAALRDAAQSAERVVIVGAGFVGCEVAATLRELGVPDVTLVEIAPYPMAALGPDVGRYAARLHLHHGVRLCMGTSVKSFEGRGRVEEVHLANGQRLGADLVLLGVGSNSKHRVVTRLRDRTVSRACSLRPTLLRRGQ